jgi:hypothetical protein
VPVPVPVPEASARCILAIVRPLLLALATTLATACTTELTPRVTPDRGSRTGGDPIRIEGDDFVGHGPPVVYVGNHAAKAVVVQSRWLVTALTPEADEEASTVDVRVVFRDGTKVELPEAFTYDEDRGLVLKPKRSG